MESYDKVFSDRDVILGGHDRGARICHRLAVDYAHASEGEHAWSAKHKLRGLVMLDIAPTLVQWQAFSDPRAVTAYFHWPFLASPLAADMIEAYGGDKWTRSGLERITGSNPEGAARAKADRAWEVYESVFRKRSTIEGSCSDYASGATAEPKMQEDDQKHGRRIEVPTLVMWSLARLGKMMGDVGSSWKPWVKEGVPLKAVGCGDDVGHYLPEEATDVVNRAIHGFLDQVI